MELCWQTVKVVSVIVVKIQKGALLPEKKINSEFHLDLHKLSTLYVLHNYKVSENFVERFQRSCADKQCWVVSFILAKFQIARYSREKKLNQNFLWICASTHYVLYNYKVSRNSVEQFQRSCADKKNRTDWRTGQKYYTFRNSLCRV